MNIVLQPWLVLFAGFSGWVNRQQQQVIDFLLTENQVWREKFGKRRILLTDDQRRRLAVKGKVLGRKLLEEVATLVTPDTILRWHRLLVAKKWDYSQRRRNPPGRPPIPEDIQALVVQLARENPSWGYDRIQGALKNLGHTISDASVGTILKAHGLEPAPQRKRQSTWKVFLKSHFEVLSAIDFTTVEVWSQKRAGDFLSSLRHGGSDPTCLLRGLHAQPRRGLDEADSPQPHRCRGWLLEREVVRAYGSG